ncbi:hypothetical protein [Cohnella faecalis]|uniref:Uncharacterized protein n=1 Tax=Cohnella faecalis TaxID=2315694 RepID=A0A398CS37_9BACL|nr:hypothetical protein [Cohnella faecalis]RIE05415.1 hypothetical protein D3H35_00570 [Cohnella faecalis]
MSNRSWAFIVFRTRPRGKRLPWHIRQIAEIGYKNVELAGYYGVSAKDLKQALADNGLHASSAHVGLTVNEPEKLEEN